MYPTHAVVTGAALLLAAALPAQGRSPKLFTEHQAARADGRFGMLLRQFRAVESELAEHHEAGWKGATPAYQDAGDIPAGHWVWRKPFWFVFRDGPDYQPQQRNWGPEAMCGEPDTAQPGDDVNAWASLAENAKGEWVLLEYAAPVRATAIDIHETFNPGAVAAIAIFTPDGREVELWSSRGNQAVAAKARVLQINLPVGFDVERVKLYLACDQVKGWNEIDAVGLRDDKGKVHWAARATASTTYADQVAGAGARGVAGQQGVMPFVARGVRIQVALPRVVVQAPALKLIELPAFQPRQFKGVVPLAGDAEKQQLRARIAELEAVIERLEAELAAAKRGNDRRLP